MRQLRPQVVEERKRRLLQWVIHRYIKTSIPVASQGISEDSGMDLSSASIRNLLKELESEGYLHQPHTSAGRVPTDKGYRFYVDFLLDAQRLAAGEKERIERQYTRSIEELDLLLSETSKLLSHVSRSAGLVLSPRMEQQALKRLELLPLGGPQVLVILVTQAGLIRHWPVELAFEPSAGQINRLNRFLNDTIQSKSVREVKAAVQSRIAHAEREIRELGTLAEQLLGAIEKVESPGELYMDGANQIFSHPEDLGDLNAIQSLLEVMEGKRTLTRILEEDMEESETAPPARPGLIHVRIGRENSAPELRNLSLITKTYRLKNQVVGVLGILGSKRMEYSRMMGLVDHVSGLVSRTLESWWGEETDGPPSAGEGRRRPKPGGSRGGRP